MSDNERLNISLFSTPLAVEQDLLREKYVELIDML